MTCINNFQYHILVFGFKKSMFDLYQQFSVSHPLFFHNKSMLDFYFWFVSTVFSTTSYFFCFKNLCLSCINNFQYHTIFFGLKNICLTCINTFQYINLFFCKKKFYVGLVSTIFSTSPYFFVTKKSMLDLYQQFWVPHPTFML